MSGRLADFAVDRRVLLITGIALFIGALSAVVAWCLLQLIGLVTNLVFYQRISDSLVSPAAHHHPWWLILGAPTAGGVVVGLMARYGSDQVRGHGMPETIEVILTGSSRVEPKVAVLKPISAAISIGTGGPFGAEGPIVMTGGAMGSVVAQFLHLTADERKILLASGAAGGIAATFNAPLASVVLAVELLLFEFRPRSLVPVASAVAMATVMRTFILGAAPVFPVEVRITEIHWPIDVLAVVVGLAGATVAIAASHLVFWAENAFPRLPIHWMWWPAIGGLIIGVGGLIEPRALGVGYNVIRAFLTGNASLSLIIGILVVKTAIWALSLGSGTSGGVFAPVFMIGSALGAFAGHWFPHVFPGFWAMLGLAAVVCGLMRAPLAAIVFTLELTRAWPAMLPVIIATITAYVVSVLLLSRSVLTEKITRTGMHLTRDYTTDPLEAFLVSEVMRAGSSPTPTGGTVSSQATLRHAANVFAETDGLPLRVVSPEGSDQGHLLLKDLLTAHLHDFNEDTERTRHLMPYFPKPPRSVLRRWTAMRARNRVERSDSQP
ncbi:chloride channel protein [Mycobacterium numidiamassiliense]|uniref:chloride channel protein n=1 Tax=Mycobacterium numidiamassiliense TaxID=1841861 RepID=UPI001C2CB074|nr:chloride channel protein [Mycobacterium numidiamassiliense]